MERRMQLSNFDQDEQKKFDEMAASWWDPNGSSRPLHELNPARLSYVNSRCPLKGQRVLDVGCGGGILAESMAAKGASVTGIDVADKALAVARLHLLESGLEVEYKATTVEDYAASGQESFDVITCMEMLEHVPDPASVIQSLAGLLRPGGHVFLSTINRNLMAFGQAILSAEYLLRLLPKGTHRYDRFIRPSELSGWVRAAGMQPQDIRGLHYDPLSRVVKTGGHVKVNYLFHARMMPE
jgi:2-polyprenyl-6-hydroxyphenyl methylase/3-demethylubiquinone-9 3-methyltransferase